MASIARKIILNVPFRKQLTESSCFPACIRMVLRYYGVVVDEKWLWKCGMILPHTGTWDVTLAPVLKKLGYKTITYWSGSIDGWSNTVPLETREKYKDLYSKSVGSGVLVHRRNASISLMKKYILSGVPVLAEVNADIFYGEKCGWTHMIVIVGFSKNFFFFHDPDKHFGGDFLRVGFSRFRKSWENLSSLAGRSMFVILPKNKRNL
ncbi:C39 family peptidase [Candidatus Woesearchaeota archaeon]|nr:C39 family peptidase [Candidatus Woesearchaeota archaeon]